MTKETGYQELQPLAQPSPGRLERYFQDRFPDSLHLQQLHLIASLGLVARECRIAYVIKASPRWLYGEDSQGDYFYLMLSALGIDETPPKQPQLWHEFNTELRKLYPELGENKFSGKMKRLLKIQAKFNQDHRSLSPEEIMDLRTLAQKTRTVSELILFRNCRINEDENEILLPDDLDPRLAYHFVDQFYWKSGGFSALSEIERDRYAHFSYLMHRLGKKALSRS